MEKPSLLDSSSDSDVELTINEDYAKSYERWREKEELQKLKDKYGDVSDTSSSSSESEDDEGPVVDKSFFKALSLVKSHDSKIYEARGALLPDSEIEIKKPKVKKEKPLFLKDYEVKVALETGGNLSDYEDDVPQEKAKFDKEQEEIKECFKGFDLSDNDDDDCSDILKVRSKTKAEQEELEEDYLTYLKGEKAISKEDEEKELAFLHDYWNDPNLTDNEQFLRNYFLNAKYKEDDKSEEIPTYEDITKDIESESEEEVAAEFEQKYNFRFQEPDSEFIKRYPRTMKDSLRRTDRRRKTKREQYTERKRVEKENRREEIKRLKALKRKEIEKKLNLLKETLDDKNVALQDIKIDSDFDPEEHDQKMNQLFSDQYYDVPENKKPSFPEDEDLDFENWDNWTGNDDAEQSLNANSDDPHCEDTELDMDAECSDPKASFQKEMIEASKQQSKKKKKSQFTSAISKKKPVFDPSEKSFEKYFNEYYKLDCEDFVGDLKTRFRYREVVPNDFGLSVDEILRAEDKELNQWCSLKRICQNRNTEEELYDVQAYKKKAQNEHKKMKIFATLYNETTAEEDNATEPETKKKKKKSKSGESSTEIPENDLSDVAEISTSDVQNAAEDQLSISNGDQGIKKKKRKKNQNVALDEGTVDAPVNGICDAKGSSSAILNGEADVSSRKNSKRKHIEEVSDVTEENGDSHQRKKRKRNRNKGKIIPQVHNPRYVKTSNFSKLPHQKKYSSQTATEEGDKRLLLSDKRLEAYGINPKKFKGKIKFSNK